MDYFNENLSFLKEFFSKVNKEDAIDEIPIAGGSTFEKKGNYYGGVYSGKKLMYSDILLKTLTPDRLQTLIKKQAL